MRYFSILTAAFVVAAIYGIVFERDRLVGFAGGKAAPNEEVSTVADETPAAVLASGERRTSVVVLASQARPVDGAIVLRGRTEAARQVDVRAETSGLVASEPLRKGASVEEGQLLCEIDPGTRIANLREAKARLAEAVAGVPDAEALVPEARSRLLEARGRAVEAKARLKEAEARLEAARVEENAASRLAESGIASETRATNARANLESARAGVESARYAILAADSGIENARRGIASAQAGIENAKAGVQAAEAAVATAEKEIERLSITAPFSGLLESDTAELGSLLQPGGLCATVIQLDTVKLVGFVPETSVHRVRPGARAVAELTSGKSVAGAVTFLSRAADEQTRTFRVEAAVPNPDLAIFDGQTVEILIEAAGTSAHFISQSALTLNDEGTLGVRVVEDGRVAFKPVSIIRDAADGVWITGLPEKSDVIVVGQEFVIDGVAVDAVYREVRG